MHFAWNNVISLEVLAPAFPGPVMRSAGEVSSVRTTRFPAALIPAGCAAHLDQNLNEKFRSVDFLDFINRRYAHAR